MRPYRLIFIFLSVTLTGYSTLVKASDLKNLKILKPRLDEEIYRISKLLLSVDNLITLQQQNLIKYQSIKKSLLQQMFM